MRRLSLTLACLTVLVASRPGRSEPLPRAFRLPVVTVGDKQYYRTWRVTSRSGLARIAGDGAFRFFQGDGQYGEAFYLFRSRRDARCFAACETARGASQRAVLAEVLLPRTKLDEVLKLEVTPELDWGMQVSGPRYDRLRELRLRSHLVFGRWAPSPYDDEPVYARMNGAKQLAVIQRGMHSVLMDALIREYKAPQRVQRPTP